MKDREEWEFMDQLQKAKPSLDEVDRFKVDSLNSYYRNMGYLTPKQKAMAGALICKSKGVRKAKAKARKAPHFLYAISDGVAVKLGFSRNPQSRKREMQTGHPSPLQVLWSIKCGDSPAEAKTAERKLHRFCSEYRKRGEWFSLDAMGKVNEFKLKEKSA